MELVTSFGKDVPWFESWLILVELLCLFEIDWERRASSDASVLFCLV